MIRKVAFSMVVAATFLSGCQSLKILENTRSVGTPFEQNLLKQYQAFAESEAEKMDWRDSEHFAHKALLLARGQYQEPENPKNWGISPIYQSQMREDRKQLVALLAQPGIRENHAETAAKAQFYFDCWVEEQEENWQPKDIATCRDGFYATLTALSDLTTVKPESASEEPTIVQSQYRVFFSHDSSLLTAETKEMLDKVVANVKAGHVKELVINGYTDTVGSEDYDLQLSKRRAMAAKNYLERFGVDPSLIQKHEPRNRRVEVNLTDMQEVQQQ
jgi:OOP family OmpA-OmpF porin